MKTIKHYMYYYHMKQIKKNICVKNIQCLLETINKYELKIKLDLLGLSFSKLVSDIYYDPEFNKSIKSSKKFILRSSYEN